MTMDGRSRWLALYVLCLGDLMIVLDGTIVNGRAPVVGAVFVVASGVIGAALLRVETPQPHGAELGAPAPAD